MVYLVMEELKLYGEVIEFGVKSVCSTKERADQLASAYTHQKAAVEGYEYTTWVIGEPLID